jgi:hypothetical protein
MKENKDLATKLEAELRKELGLKSAIPDPPLPTPEQKQAAAAAHSKTPVARK